MLVGLVWESLAICCCCIHQLPSWAFLLTRNLSTFLLQRHASVCNVNCFTHCNQTDVFTDASSATDTAGISKHRLSPYIAYYRNVSKLYSSRFRQTSLISQCSVTWVFHTYSPTYVRVAFEHIELNVMWLSLLDAVVLWCKGKWHAWFVQM